MIDEGIAEDMATLRSVAREAGHLARELRPTASKSVWDKSPGHPVTQADLAVNTLIARRLGAARPNYGWLSEETVDDHSNRSQPRIWVVDPIDGTRAYVRDGDPHWCIGLAVVEAGVPLAGVIYAPDFDHLYEARRGGGAFRNGRPIFASSCAGEGGCRMISTQEVIRHKDWREPWPEMTLADPKPNATLLRLALVASGEWDATLTLWRKSDWDIAPGAVLVEEAGGIATTHLGEAFAFNRSEPAQRSLIAAGKQLHPLLRRRTERVSLKSSVDSATPLDTHIKTGLSPMSDTAKPTKQLLHLVLGGELKDVTDVEFEDLAKIDFVGAFPNYAAAYDAWKSAAQRTVDNAEMRYFILHAHKLLDPETGNQHDV
ncbi:MAG: inositol monophosphatase family protein [Pseudomonadota bacterium]